VDQRVADLLGRMTLAEKIGQMGQINVEVLQGAPDTPWDRGPLNPDLMADVLDKNQIGSILSGGGAWPPVGDDGKAWAEEINAIQQFGLDHSRLRIPIIYGVDAVHGHNNLVDATMVPHQIGLGATFDPATGQFTWDVGFASAGWAGTQGEDPAASRDAPGLRPYRRESRRGRQIHRVVRLRVEIARRGFVRHRHVVLPLADAQGRQAAQRRRVLSGDHDAEKRHEIRVRVQGVLQDQPQRVEARGILS
jgi:hypothetical protein